MIMTMNDEYEYNDDDAVDVNIAREKQIFHLPFIFKKIFAYIVLISANAQSETIDVHICKDLIKLLLLLLFSWRLLECARKDRQFK
jgi:hypothetical protein